MRLLIFLLVMLFSGFAWSQGREGESLDAAFDKTGDGLVDAADWGKMSEEEKAAYANASIRALGEDLDTGPDNGVRRSQQYLNGLRSVYEK